MDFKSVKEALEHLYLISQSDEVKVDGVAVSVDDYKEFISEAVTSVLDLLGMEEIYLKEHNK